MIPETTITICGEECLIRYCAAAEMNYEQITGQRINIFVPEFGTDEDGKTIVIESAKATAQDFIVLGFGAILAAYSKIAKDAPITLNDILYDAAPLEVAELIKTVVQLRNQWYKVPDIVTKDEIQGDGEGEDAEKND